MQNAECRNKVAVSTGTELISSFLRLGKREKVCYLITSDSSKNQ